MISRAPIDLCFAQFPGQLQQPCRLGSRRILARECHSGSLACRAAKAQADLDCDHDRNRNGSGTPHRVLSSNWHHRVSLFVRRSRRRVRLHRGDGGLGLTPIVIRPTALVLNILVASIGAFQFWRAGHFSWKLFWPFALLSVPAAYLGGYLQLPASILKIPIESASSLSSNVCFFAATCLTSQSASASGPGAGAELVSSGLTGTGGGIFLTLILLFAIGPGRNE